MYDLPFCKTEARLSGVPVSETVGCANTCLESLRFSLDFYITCIGPSSRAMQKIHQLAE